MTRDMFSNDVFRIAVFDPQVPNHGLLSPLRGSLSGDLLTQGWRPGLHSIAAPRLFPATHAAPRLFYAARIELAPLLNQHELMRMRRFLLIATATISALLGAVVAWLVLTVPNDLQAGVLLRAARNDVEAGRNDRARLEYSRVIQQYPRTDAAAAATVALASIADSERHILSAALDQQRRTLAAQQKQIADLAAQITAIRNTPPPAPVVIQAPPPPAKKTPPQHSPRKRHR